MNKYFLMVGPFYYGVTVFVGEKSITVTKIENEATITTEKDVVDSLSFLEEKGIKAKAVLIDKSMTALQRKEFAFQI